jgi:hypothetical protein
VLVHPLQRAGRRGRDGLGLRGLGNAERLPRASSAPRLRVRERRSRVRLRRLVLRDRGRGAGYALHRRLLGARGGEHVPVSRPFLLRVRLRARSRERPTDGGGVTADARSRRGPGDAVARA